MQLKQKVLARKRIITISILVLLVGIIIRDLYREEQEDIEEYYVEKVLSKAPKNLNAKAIHKIQKSLNTRNDFSFVVLGDSQGRFKTFRKVVKDALKHKPNFFVNPYLS